MKKQKELQEALKEYFGGDYTSILNGETETAKTIRDGIDRMPTYEGSISRGMILNNSDVRMFSDLKKGDELPRRGIIESWTSNKGTAIGYGGISDYEREVLLYLNARKMKRLLVCSIYLYLGLMNQRF